MIKHEDVAIVTDAAGAATARTNGARAGKLLAIFYDQGTLADTSDIVVTTDKTAQTVWQQDDVTSDVVVYPTAVAQDTAKPPVARTYDATRVVPTPIVIMAENLKLVIAQGGDSKIGRIRYVWEE